MSGQPNILVFFCDQLRIDLLRCYGGTLVRTPALDRLAAESVVFENAYTPTALCSPARASLMTGVYPHTHHMFNNSSPGYSYCQHLRPEMTMVQDWAADHTDYETAYYGKWHIGPAEDLFHSRFHHKHPRPYEGGPPFLAGSHWHPGLDLGPVVQDVCRGQAGTIDVPMEGFPDVVAARCTQEFLRSHDDTRPFLCLCAFPGPHSPWRVPEEFGIRYDPNDIPPWPNQHDTLEGKPMNQRKVRYLSEKMRPGIGDREHAELRACLFSYMELIDQMVGEVLETLRQTEQADNTVVVFTADHGDMNGSHGFLSKGSYMYDEIYRIPLIVRSPNAAAPRRARELVHLMDITASCMHWMSGRPQDAMGEQRLHGASLVPLVRDPASRWDRPVHYAEYHGDWFGHYSARMVTDTRWKLVWNLSHTGELYDLIDDPLEMRNRFHDPECRETCRHYLNLVKSEAARLEDGHLRRFDPEMEFAVT